METPACHRRNWIRPCLFLLAGLLLTALAVPPACARIQTHFLYKLANFNGSVTATWARVSIDRYRNETYLIDGEMVRVFDENGMEIYRFGEDGRLGFVMDVAVLKSGDILVLARTPSWQGIQVCDFRGIPKGRLALKEVPPPYSDFIPDKMVLRKNRLYLLGNHTLQVIVADETGRFLEGIDLGRLLPERENKLRATEIEGFNVDDRGNILFTIPVNFSAHALTPEGKLISYVRPGGAPGKFNLISGIVADAQGYYYIADRLKNVVQVFDSSFSFIRQFGYRGPNRDNLFGPRFLAFDSRNRLHVSQVGEKGVSVFQIRHEPKP